MNAIDQATILTYHRECTQNYGRGTPGALGWRGEGSQRIRFSVLAEIADLNDRLILDLGCGHGDLRAFLAARYPRVRYVGIDHHASFLEVAREKYGSCPDTEFILGEFSTAALPIVDYALASGALSYRQRDPTFAYAMISKCFAAARLGAGFNFLRHFDCNDAILATFDPAVIVDYCRELTPKVTLREGYLDEDFTVFLYRED